METRHPVEGSFGCEFPAICNHCVVMAIGVNHGGTGERIPQNLDWGR